MRRYLKVFALVAILGLIAAACGGDDDGGGTTGPTATGTGPTGETGPMAEPGGTLELAMIGDVSAAFDPQKEYYSVTWEYFRCCLLRTLLSYNGRTTAEGGAELQPDIATALPEISSDGLTYTFTLKSGINYSPPFEDVAVTSQDIVRALEREADPDAAVNGYNFYYNIIKGFEEFGAGDADTIEGLTTPDESTLVVELTGPSGYLPYLFSMHATAPIPPDADNEPLGAADGHTPDYGRFLVATGPYMFAGSENLDFSVPADEQDPVAGYNPGQSIQLVRNPSYDPATDGLRPAYPDAINVSIGGDETDLFNQVVAGQLDAVVDGVVPAQILRQYSTDPTLQPFLHINPSDAVRYISFNMAEPPFDDIAVRKAFNLALDKGSMRTLRGGESVGELAGHIMVNSLENNLLADYDPFATPNSAGDIAAAQTEMANSKYDTDGDGVCDAPECSDILAITDEADPYPDQAALIQQNMEPLGLTFDVKSFERTTMYAKCNDPSAHGAICLAPAWGKDFPDGYTFADPLFGSAAIFPSCCNYGLVGASADLLQENDYSVTDVPSADDQIADANAQTGDARFQAWADLDTLLMEEIVPWAPYLFDNNVDIISNRIVNYSFDQFAGLAAWDQLAIAPEAQ
ncbi:MAG: ABC transporter substrate-binding protein [Actinomycetota bacterium]